MTAGEMSAALAAWRAQVEAEGKGFPTEAELLDLMVVGGEIEKMRIERGLEELYEREVPALFKLKSGPWRKKVKAVLDGRHVIENGGKS